MSCLFCVVYSIFTFTFDLLHLLAIEAAIVGYYRDVLNPGKRSRRGQQQQRESLLDGDAAASIADNGAGVEGGAPTFAAAAAAAPPPAVQFRVPDLTPLLERIREVSRSLHSPPPLDWHS